MTHTSVPAFRPKAKLNDISWSHPQKSGLIPKNLAEVKKYMAVEYP